MRKILLYVLLALGIWFLYWFLPKYSYVTENPGYCAQLTSRLYYCGDNTNMNAVFGPSR